VQSFLIQHSKYAKRKSDYNQGKTTLFLLKDDNTCVLVELFLKSTFLTQDAGDLFVKPELSNNEKLRKFREVMF
jgi:hypothetical protein